VNKNFVNIYLRRILQFGKQFPRNRDGKYMNKAERKIKQMTEAFSIHSIAVTGLTAAGSTYGALYYGNYSKNNYSNKIQ
jgi:hypothetical protein